MRILYISHSFPLPGEPLSNVGGMQRVAVDLYRALEAHPAVQVSAICLETSWRMTGLRTGPFLLSLLWRIPAALKDGRFDVVLFSSMVTAAVAPLVADRVHAAGAVLAAIPVGRDLTLPSPAYQRLVRRVLRDLDLVFPISRATGQEARSRGATANQVRVVPCGIDFARVSSYDSSPSAKEQLRTELTRRGFWVPDNGFFLLSVGRHQERKGFHWFAGEVMPLLSPDVVYLVAGAGPMSETIRERAGRAGVADRVCLLGQVSEELLGLLYAGSDLFVMPNIPVEGDIEGFGVVMLEAGAAGLPVLAADLEGIRDVVTPEVNGWLVPSGDPAGFLRRIEEFRGNAGGPSIRERAAQHVRAKFGWNGVVDQFLEAFRALRRGLRVGE